MLIKECCMLVNDKVDAGELSLSNYISTENLRTNFSGFDNSSSLPNCKVTKFKLNDILISNIRPYFKKGIFCAFDGGCSNDVLCIRNISDKYLNKYIYYALTSDSFINLLVSSCKGTKMPRGDKIVLLNYDLQNISIEDQQHIVNILGSIDEKIENNELKIQKTRMLMANLFNRISLNNSSERIGNLIYEIKARLKDKVSKVYSVINSGELVEQDSYFDREIHSKDMYKYKIIKKFDFAYNPSRINIGSIAMFEHELGAVSPIYVAFSCDKKYSYYINEFIKTPQFNKEIYLRANGSVRQSINYDVLKEIQMPQPKDDKLVEFNEKYQTLQENVDSLKNENKALAVLKQLYLKKFFR